MSINRRIQDAFNNWGGAPQDHPTYDFESGRGYPQELLITPEDQAGLTELYDRSGRQVSTPAIGKAAVFPQTKVDLSFMHAPVRELPEYNPTFVASSTVYRSSHARSDTTDE